ncbi:MAG: exopolysaccharide biosynthesis polyprenyl glycosylphosphotransferase [Bacteroidetes bacterium CG12_big_fil_rev_8_21_14_0_65_60_17]|nr:MAG: exopolysaccharide biosynthesis polyprenyl glycosylphosphotransferase [Bacteroidetes bacterium CG12_big_fil_rev_8_21_14_0_65_60_17]
MSRRVELLALLFVDAIAVALANALWYKARFDWGWLPAPVFRPEAGIAWLVIALLTVFWLLFFLFLGLYRERYAGSRFDEFVSILQAATLGILVLFFVLFIESLDALGARTNLAAYWLAIVVFVSFGRIVVRSLQKVLILQGKGLHRALIVGWSNALYALHEEVARYPEAGLDIVGAVRLGTGLEDGPESAADVLREDDGLAPEHGGREAPVPFHDIEDLPHLIDRLDIQDVLIALGSSDGEALMKVLTLCDGKNVHLKLVPDFYSIIGGMARTEHMYGLPLIEVQPEPMQVWEYVVKRLLDVVVSLVVLLIGLPLWIVIGLLVRVTSHGPAIYRQKRIGRHGKPFTMYKFRTMKNNAEAGTGPVWAQANDPRYTALGRWLRRTRLDEIPQFVNVLRGDMSLVGPRPERPYFVEKLARDIPLYNRRHRVKPGITGWAQVKWKYDTSLEDVRQKVKYDLFYIENMSLKRDFQILFRTIYTALRGSGQ